MSHEFPDFNSPLIKIEDAANQLMHFRMLPDIERAKNEIQKANLRSLEEYTGKTTQELNKAKPGVCEKYNALVEQFKDPNITLERIKELSQEVWNVVK